MLARRYICHALPWFHLCGFLSQFAHFMRLPCTILLSPVHLRTFSFSLFSRTSILPQSVSASNKRRMLRTVSPVAQSVTCAQHIRLGVSERVQHSCHNLQPSDPWRQPQPLRVRLRPCICTGRYVSSNLEIRPALSCLQRKNYSEFQASYVIFLRPPR
jgi:hypothetical protein